MIMAIGHFYVKLVFKHKSNLCHSFDQCVMTADRRSQPEQVFQSLFFFRDKSSDFFEAKKKSYSIQSIFFSCSTFFSRHPRFKMAFKIDAFIVVMKSVSSKESCKRIDCSQSAEFRSPKCSICCAQ